MRKKIEIKREHKKNIQGKHIRKTGKPPLRYNKIFCQKNFLPLMREARAHQQNCK